MRYILDTRTKEPADFQDKLRKHFRPIADKSQKSALPKMPFVQNVALVGALYDGNTQTGLSLNDHQHLQYALNTVATYGIPIARDFSVAVRNLAYNDNVLTNPRPSDQKVDLWVQCFVFNPDKPKKKKGISKDTSFYCQVAEEHFQPAVWAESADKSGADIIIAYANGPHEIGPGHFVAPSFTRTDNLDPLLYDASGILFRKTYAERLKTIGREHHCTTALTMELDRVL